MSFVFLHCNPGLEVIRGPGRIESAKSRPPSLKGLVTNLPLQRTFASLVLYCFATMLVLSANRTNETVPGTGFAGPAPLDWCARLVYKSAWSNVFIKHVTLNPKR